MSVEDTIIVQKRTDALICQCGHTYGVHAGHGGGCLECHGWCEKFALPEPKTRFPEGAEL
jgi:hypothetical protein